MKLSVIAAALGTALLAAQPTLAHGPAAGSAAERAEIDHLMDQEMAQDNIYRVHVPNADIGRKAAISLHDNLLETNWEEGYLVVQLDAAELKRLEPFKFRIEKDTAFIAKRNQMLQRLRAAGTPNILGEAGARLSAQAGIGTEAIPSFPCYETVEETYTAAQAFTSTYPNLADWSFIGESWQKTQGLGGYDVGVLKLTNKQTTGPNGEAKPKLFLNSAIHAREYATAPLALAFARQLLTGYGTDADATWILDHHEVHLLLQTNPDGRKKAETGLSWRKNTNTNYCGVNSNSRGADLNRNFTNSWNSTNGQGSSGSQCSDTYRGPSPASEPETQNIEAYVRSLWPDRRGPAKTDAAPADTSGIHIDMHSYSELVLWPWGDTRTVAPNGPALQTLGRKFAFFNGYLPQASIGLYATDGTSDGVSYGELGVAAFTIEMGTSFFQSCSSFESNIKPKNLPVLTYAAKVVRTPYLTPAGPDVTSVTLSGTAATTGVKQGKKVKLTAMVTDSQYSTRKGTEPVQSIEGVEVFIDTPPWMPGAVAMPLKAADGVFDSATEGAVRSMSTASLSKGKHMVFVRGRDTDGNLGAVTASFLVIR